MDQLSGPGGENLERRAILATVLALIVLLGYYAFFMPAPPPPLAEPEKAQPKVAEEVTPPVSTTKQESPSKTQPITEPLKRAEREEEVVLETDLLSVTLSNRGGGVRSWKLKQYEEAAGFVDLVGALPEEEAPLPLATSIQGGEGANGLYRIVERPRSRRIWAPIP